MLKFNISNKEETLRDLKKAEELIKELGTLFHRMGIEVEIKEEPSVSTDNSTIS